MLPRTASGHEAGDMVLPRASLVGHPAGAIAAHVGLAFLAAACAPEELDWPPMKMLRALVTPRSPSELNAPHVPGRGPWFEGWYTRINDAAQGRSFAIVAGSHVSAVPNAEGFQDAGARESFSAELVITAYRHDMIGGLFGREELVEQVTFRGAALEFGRRLHVRAPGLDRGGGLR